MNKIDKFNYKYSHLGGFDKLYNMAIEEHQKRESIALHFGVSRTTVTKWLIALLGENPLSIENRRIRKIDTILEYMKTHSAYETKKSFSKMNKEYFKEALFLAEKQGIYPQNIQNAVNQPNSVQSTNFPQQTI